MQKHVDRENSQYRIFEVGIFVHEDRDHTNVRKKAACTANNVLFREPELSRCVKSPIVDRVVVTFGQELHSAVSPKNVRC